MYRDALTKLATPWSAMPSITTSPCTHQSQKFSKNLSSTKPGPGKLIHIGLKGTFQQWFNSPIKFQKSKAYTRVSIKWTVAHSIPASITCAEAQSLPNTIWTNFSQITLFKPKPSNGIAKIRLLSRTGGASTSSVGLWFWKSSKWPMKFSILSSTRCQK